jgi:hypothetical protein
VTTTCRLAKQALAVYLFLPATGPDRHQAYTYLRGIWAACGDQLGMREAIPSFGLPTELATSPGPDSNSQPMAARQRPGQAIKQAIVLRTHDIFTLVVMLAPEEGSGIRWEQLDQQWSALVENAPLGAVAGEARLYLALLDCDHEPPAGGGLGHHSSDVLACAAGLVRAAMPTALDAPDGWWHRTSASGPALGLWEASSAEDSRPGRRIAVITTSDREAALDEWLWTSGDAKLPPFGRYLLHMAKIRYELRVHAGGYRVRQLRDQADTQVEDLLGLLAPEQEGAGRVADDDGLVAASTRLLTVRAGSAGLIEAGTRLREMRRTVQIASANMTAALGPRPGQTGPLADDRALADWFALQLDDDALYVETARERTRDVADVITTVVQHRLQQRQDDARERQERFNLLQTAVIGAVILGLTAVQALGYQLPLPGPLKPPVISALGAVALLLATVVVRLTLSSGRQLLAWPSYLTAGLTAAAVAWLLVAWVSADGVHKLAAPATTWLLAGVGFVAGVGGAYMVSTRRSRR